LLDDAIEDKRLLTDNFSLNTAKRIIQIFRLCDWAIDSKLIENNPFRGMSKKIKIFKSDKEKWTLTHLLEKRRNY